jgi:hypothetical protein
MQVLDAIPLVQRGYRDRHTWDLAVIKDGQVARLLALRQQFAFLPHHLAGVLAVDEGYMDAAVELSQPLQACRLLEPDRVQVGQERRHCLAYRPEPVYLGHRVPRHAGVRVNHI